MRARKSYMPACFGAWALLSLFASGPAAAQDPPAFVPDEFIVVLTPQAAGTVNVTAGPTVNLASLQNVIEAQNVTAFSRKFPAAQPEPVGSPFHDLTGHYKAKIGPTIDLDTAIAAFAADTNVEDVGKISILGLHYCATGAPITPNDPHYEGNQENPENQFYLWGPNGIDADLAWRRRHKTPNRKNLALSQLPAGPGFALRRTEQT